jgi:hypothetical protein
MKLVRKSVFVLIFALPLFAVQRPQGPSPGAGRELSSIAGTVVNDDGQPLAGVLVRALQPTFDTNGATNMVPVGRPSISDASGQYALTGLVPDVYLVSVDPASANTRVRPFFATVFYPSSTDWRSATPVDLSSGPAYPVDVEVRLRDLIQVGGPILNTVDPESRVSGFYVSPVDDISTSLIRISNSARDTRTSFQIQGLTPGTYDVFPTFAKGNEPARVSHVRLTVPRNLQGVTMEILPGTDVAGKIDVQGFDDAAPVDFAKIKVGLLSRKGELVSPPPVAVGDDGMFTIPGVPEMEYQLSVTGLPPNAYIRAAVFDNNDALYSWIPVRRHSQRLQIVVDTAGGEISGRLVDIHRQLFGKGASLVLVPAQRKGDLPAPGLVVVPTDRFGTFVVRAVPPGDYRVLAWSNPNGHPYFNPDVMTSYLGMGDLVHVYRGSRIQAEAVVVDTP